LKAVVDTNVAVIANGGAHVSASPACQINCIEILERCVASGQVFIDDLEEILTLYDARLRPQGEPGVGDRFYRHLLNNLGNARRVTRVTLAHQRANRLHAAFLAGSLAQFDPDDRVYALCGAVSRAPVKTATDSDWLDHEAGLVACGVQIHFVCGKAAAQKKGASGA
jgi:hypothetical protein